jgi:hypothetical protein
MVNQIESINHNISNLKDGTLSSYPFDVETSVYLLKKINEGAQHISESYQTICETIVSSIRQQMYEAYDYAYQLETLDPVIVHKWCRDGVRKEKGFTANRKSLENLKMDSDNIIDAFLADKNNTDMLDALVDCDKEVEDLLNNIGAFLYEMACEDNPFGDNSKLYNKIWNHHWKYHKNHNDFSS